MINGEFDIWDRPNQSAIYKFMINIIDPKDCSGCTACRNICPVASITMEADGLGFLYPKVDLSTCIECGLCEKVCPFNDNYDIVSNLEKPHFYGARHKKKEEVAASRSGAAFIAISDYVLKLGGVVYGAAFSDGFKVEHKRAISSAERDEFRGSKYVQSDLNDVFQQVKQDLKDGRMVLFSGTPCQTAGLGAFIDKRLREKLILVDVLCHGVPSPLVWSEYLKYLEKKEKNKIVEVSFRDKGMGWSAHRESYRTDRLSKTKFRRTFSDLFYDHVMFRHSCSNCFYCNTRRPSDLTLGDFWGWEKKLYNLNCDDRGLSLLIVNTSKGETIFEAIKEELIYEEVDLSDCLQPSLEKRIECSPYRMDFERRFLKDGFYKTARHFKALGAPFMIKRLKSKTKTLRRIIVNKIKGL